MARNVTFEKLAEQRILLSEATIVYEPSVYGGDGSEPRKNVVLTLPPEAAQPIQELEAGIDPTRLVSSMKDGTVKAKIMMPDVRVYDSDKNLVGHPVKWRDCVVNAVIVVKGKWASKTQAGLSMEVTDLQVLDRVPQQACPF
jgi:hypothetical protein